MGIKAIHDYRNAIEEISKLTEIDELILLEPIKKGKWSIREIVGHLYYWDKFILEHHAPSMSQGATLIAFPDHDLHNNEAIQHISSYNNFAFLIDKFVCTRNQLLDMINDINDDIRFFIDLEKSQFTIESYISMFTEHDNHHFKQIRNKLIK